MSIITIIMKCIVIGIIWAALLIPIIFKRGGAIKYIVTVLLIAFTCYIFCFGFFKYAWLVNTMTIIALISLVLSWILSMAVFEKESKVKSKVIAFTCVVSGISYLVATLFFNGFAIL